MTMTTERPLPRDIEVRTPVSTGRPGEQRLTRLQHTRAAWDYIIAAHYHYHEPKLGYRRLGKLFEMPVSTVRSIVGRTPAHHPGVRDAAVRFQLLRPVGLQSLPGPVPLDLLDDLLEGKPYPEMPEPEEKLEPWQVRMRAERQRQRW